MRRLDIGEFVMVGYSAWKKMGERSAFCGSKHKRIDKRSRRIGDYYEEEMRLVG